MKNKKGVSIGRIILFILFIFLFIAFIWSLVITFKAMKKESGVTNKHVNSSLRMVDNNSNVVRNLYNKQVYPFDNYDDRGERSNYYCQTGSFIWVEPGTYSVTINSSILSGYRYGFCGSTVPGFNRWGNTIFDSGWQTSSSCSLTVTSGCYLSIFFNKINGGVVDLSFINSFDYMINEGSPHSYIAYDNNFVNALDYVSNAYFEGSASFTINNFYDQGDITASVYGFYPVISSTNERSTYKTTYNLNIVNQNDLIIGDNIESLYSYINNRTYSDFFYSYSYSFNYNDATDFINVYYECSSPIPINYFNFTFNGNDILSNSSTGLYVNANDNISVYTTFNNNNKFTFQDLLNVNPNITHIYNFGFSIYNKSTQSNIGIQNKPWSSYSSSCNFHIVFDNFYGDSTWQQGYDEGFRAGQEAADEGLTNQNIDLQNQVNDLTAQISSLTATLNEQSNLIRTMQEQINSFGSGEYSFRNLFWTIADTPFKTMHNVLNFDFFGVNLFRFFVGVITSLGMIWLIKKFI